MRGSGDERGVRGASMLTPLVGNCCLANPIRHVPELVQGFSPLELHVGSVFLV
jgi:hypothetical protein